MPPNAANYNEQHISLGRPEIPRIVRLPIRIRPLNRLGLSRFSACRGLAEMELAGSVSVAGRQAEMRSPVVTSWPGLAPLPIRLSAKSALSDGLRCLCHIAGRRNVNLSTWPPIASTGPGVGSGQTD